MVKQQVALLINYQHVAEKAQKKKLWTWSVFFSGELSGPSMPSEKAEDFSAYEMFHLKCIFKFYFKELIFSM